MKLPISIPAILATVLVHAALLTVLATLDFNAQETEIAPVPLSVELIETPPPAPATPVSKLPAKPVVPSPPPPPKTQPAPEQIKPRPSAKPEAPAKPKPRDPKRDLARRDTAKPETVKPEKVKPKAAKPKEIKPAPARRDSTKATAAEPEALPNNEEAPVAPTTPPPPAPATATPTRQPESRRPADSPDGDRPVRSNAPATPPPSAPAARTSASIASYAATNRKPPYPRLSRSSGEQGTVVLKVLVQADGTVGALEIARSSGYPLLDQSATSTVRTWRFNPATVDGRPVSEWYQIPIPFTLHEP